MARAKKAGRTTAKRRRKSPVEVAIGRRLGELRQKLLELMTSAAPGAVLILRQRPAIEAEIWACESQLAALAGEHDRAERANAEAQRCQAEARRAALLVAAEELADLERRVGLNTELAAELRRLPK